MIKYIDGLDRPMNYIGNKAPRAMEVVDCIADFMINGIDLATTNKKIRYLQTLNELPSKAFDERFEEHMRSNNLKDLNDYRLTKSAEQVIADAEKLSDKNFSEFLQHAILNFPNPKESGMTLYTPNNFYMRCILCTVAVEASLKRNLLEADREKLLSALTTVRNYETDIPTFDDLDEEGRDEADVNIEDLIVKLSKGFSRKI